jgi:hypothetical protein
MRHWHSASNIILLITLLSLGVVVAFLAPNKAVHESPTNSAPASNPITLAPSAPPVLPTLPPIGPSPTPEDPNAPITEVPILTPRVLIPRTVPSPIPSDPYEIIVNGERGIFDPKEITKMSEVVVVGTVRKVMPARWTTADGKRPSNPHAPDNTHTIYRPVLIDIELPIKGIQNKQSLILFAWGGVVGNDSARSSMDNLYTFNQGDRVVVFLNKQGNNLNNEPLWSIIEHYTIDGQDNANNGYQSIPLQKLLDDVRSAL